MKECKRPKNNHVPSWGEHVKWCLPAHNTAPSEDTTHSTMADLHSPQQTWPKLQNLTGLTSGRPTRVRERQHPTPSWSTWRASRHCGGTLQQSPPRKAQSLPSQCVPESYHTPTLMFSKCMVTVKLQSFRRQQLPERASFLPPNITSCSKIISQHENLSPIIKKA